VARKEVAVLGVANSACKELRNADAEATRKALYAAQESSGSKLADAAAKAEGCEAARYAAVDTHARSVDELTASRDELSARLTAADGVVHALERAVAAAAVTRFRLLPVGWAFSNHVILQSKRRLMTPRIRLRNQPDTREYNHNPILRVSSRRSRHRRPPLRRWSPPFPTSPSRSSPPCSPPRCSAFSSSSFSADISSSPGSRGGRDTTFHHVTFSQNSVQLTTAGMVCVTNLTPGSECNRTRRLRKKDVDSAKAWRLIKEDSDKRLQVERFSSEITSVGGCTS
jgi:hypothetical protein